MTGYSAKDLLRVHLEHCPQCRKARVMNTPDCCEHGQYLINKAWKEQQDAVDEPHRLK